MAAKLFLACPVSARCAFISTRKRCVPEISRLAVKQGFPVEGASPTLERRPPHAGEVARERSPIDGVSDALEPAVHRHAIVTHGLADYIERELDVDQLAIEDLRQDAYAGFAGQLVAAQVVALAGVACRVFEDRDRRGGNILGRDLREGTVR